MRPVRKTAALVLLGLVLAACGGESTSSEPAAAGGESSSPAGDSSSPSASTSSSSPPDATDSETAMPKTASWPTKDREQLPRRSGPASVLKEIRQAAHPSYDRLVLEFRRPVSGYHVGYVAEVTQDPSDRAVPLEGDAFLRVVVLNATADNAFQVPPGMRYRYVGPSTVTPGLEQLRQVKLAGDFEATLSLGVGVASKTGFKVQVLRSPARLVIDLSHG